MNIEERVEQVLKPSYFEKGVTGLRCAAAFFFKKDTNELSLGQFALLVGMIKSPSLYNPTKNPERAQKRRNKVLDVWLEEGLIAEAEAKTAMNETLN